MMMGFFSVHLFFYIRLFKEDPGSNTPEGKTIIVYGYLFFYHFQYISIALILIYNFLKRRNIEKLLKLLETFDDHCEKMRWKYRVNHKKNYWRLIFWVVFSLISLITVLTMELLWMPPDRNDYLEYISNVFYCFVIEGFVLSSLQFIFGCYGVASRFEILNQNTRFYLSAPTKEMWQRVHIENNIKVVKKVAFLHNVLNDAIAEINGIFTIQLLPILILGLTNSILIFYMTILAIQYNKFTFIILISYHCWNMFQVIPIVVSLHFGSKNVHNCHQLLTSMKTFMIQMRQRKAILTCGLFNIDWTLAFSIVGTITTYLVIICQFESENEED
ncbi:unnamed protein product [Diamesa tonsa]